MILLAICIVLTAAQDGPPPPGPSPPKVGVPGPRPECRNKIRGCVQYEPNNYVRWLPSPCKICNCFKGKEVCGLIGCQGFPGPDPCFGRPLTKVGYRPSVCCPRCDFGVPEQACRAVPDKRRSYSISHKGGRCTGTVIEHKCDKIGYRKGGEKFRCVPVQRTRYVSLRGPRCNPFSRIGYSDVTYCRAVKDDTLRGAEGCDKFIRVVGVPGPVGAPGPR